MKGLQSRRLLGDVSAPRSAGVCDLLLLGAMLKLLSSAERGCQLGSGGEEGLQHRAACSEPALGCSSSEVSSGFPEICRQVIRLLRSPKEREVRDVRTY